MTGFRIYDVQQITDAHEEAMYGNDPGFRVSLHSTAARALAEGIIREAAIYERREPKKGDRLYGRGGIYHRWSIGLQTDGDAITARLADMEHARRQGRAEAAAILEEAARRYDHREGGCAGVLAAELMEMAKVVEKYGE